VLVSGLAADIDWLSYFGGASTFLAWHRTASDSLVGASAIAVIAATVFWFIGRRHALNPVRLARALAVSCAGAGLHLLLDLTNSYGVKLLWPLSQRWYAWDLAPSLDPLLIALLLAALFLPTLFRMVSTEIGARPGRRKADFGVIAILGLVLFYFGGRAIFHEQAVGQLDSRRYQGAEPIRVAAFPEAAPFNWRGVVETDGTVAEIDVPSFGATFDTDRARVQFKPMESATLDRARQTPAVRAFLSFARFPLATVTRSDEGYDVLIRDLRFASVLPGEAEIRAVVNLNGQSQVASSKLEFASPDKTNRP
jgi:inner membrane protein